MTPINNEYHLDEFCPSDIERLAQVINHEEIARNTLTVPFPYKIRDAEWWIGQIETRKAAGEDQLNWAIRNREKLVCGGIGIHRKYGAQSHKDEFGYWLMEPLWGKGIMTNVVKHFTNYCFEELGLTRLEAPIFEFNKGSARVLEKVGFTCEGRQRMAYLKNGEYFDSLLYAKVKEQG